MDGDSWWLRILWKWPQLPKKKIKLFLRLGDRYREHGDERLAVYCYQRSYELANSIRAVHLLKKIKERVDKQGIPG